MGQPASLRAGFKSVTRFTLAGQPGPACINQAKIGSGQNGLGWPVLTSLDRYGVRNKEIPTSPFSSSSLTHNKVRRRRYSDEVASTLPSQIRNNHRSSSPHRFPIHCRGHWIPPSTLLSTHRDNVYCQNLLAAARTSIPLFLLPHLRYTGKEAQCCARILNTH